MKSLAQQHGAALINNLLKLAMHSESDDVQVKATKELLDRGYGKAVAQHNLAGYDGGPLGIADMPLDSLVALAEKIQATLRESDDAKARAESNGGSVH